MNKICELKAIDFFCGAGGMTYGLTQAGIKVLAGVDNDPSCKETYSINNPSTLFIEINIHKLSLKKLVSLTAIKKNDDALVFIGCSPCQYWTKIRTTKKKAIESKTLLTEFQRFVKHFRPGFIIIENVPGLLTNKTENELAQFLRFLKEEGYTYDHGIINANHYGVPQNRRRYLLVATRLSTKIKLPKGEHNLGLVVENFIGIHNGFPNVEAGHKDSTDFLHTVARLSENNLKRIKKTPKNGGTRLSWKGDSSLQIDAYRNKDHIFRDVYGRMRWDRPAPTITTRFNSLSNGRFGHPEENRALSLREGATLQTFPKTYKFRGNDAIKARQIGNAVPPELAKKIGVNIKRSYIDANISR
jgi:DNA (cytosine-5)-methyltransferase 1